MARKDTITYQAVAEVCYDIIKSGEKPSVRKVATRIGGSFATISGFLQRWQEQQSLARSVDAEISDELKQAILAEFARVVAQVKEALNAEILEKTEQLTESRELLSEHESNLDLLKQQLIAAQDLAKQEQLRLEKELAAAGSKVEVSNKREAKLQEQLDHLREKCHAAEVKAAVAAATTVELEKRIALLAKEPKSKS